MSSVETEIADAMRAHGMIPPDQIEFDGKIHRFGRKKSGWYVGFYGGVKAGAFGDFKLGITEKFVESHKTMTAMDRRRIGKSMKDAAVLRQKELEEGHEKVADIVTAIWRDAKPVTTNPYLERKRVPAYKLRVVGDWLLVPVTDGKRIWSLQRITATGEKPFYPGGKVQSHFYPIGLREEPKDLIICEGIATGLTIYHLQKVPVVVAFSAGNLIPVAERMRSEYPDTSIVIAGDNDHANPLNPGKAAAELAAIRSTAAGNITKWIVPDFSGLPFTEKDTDFNDLAILRGDL